MRNLRLSSSATIALADGQGRVVMQTDGPDFGRVDLATDTAAFHLHRQDDGSEWVYAAAPIFGDELYVVFPEPQQKLLSVANRFWVQNLIRPIATMIFASLAVWWGVQSNAIRWFGQLRNKATAIADSAYDPGKFNFAHAAPEIQDFARTLHKMADDIAAQRAGLNDALAHSHELAREINHRVKNNLQIILSLRHMRASQLAPSDAREILNKTLARLTDVSIAQRLTYEQGEMIDHGLVDLGALLEALVRQWQINFADKPQTIDQQQRALGTIRQHAAQVDVLRDHPHPQPHQGLVVDHKDRGIGIGGGRHGWRSTPTTSSIASAVALRTGRGIMIIAMLKADNSRQARFGTINAQSPLASP